MRLPGNPPPGCRTFLTANMSGCRFFVDHILGSSDIIVYHANTHAHGSPPGSAVNSQSAAASSILASMRDAARQDYRGMTPSVIPIFRSEVVKYDYYYWGEAELLRKKNQGRTIKTTIYQDVGGSYEPVPGPSKAPDFQGGTTICGFFDTRWRFYYQTFGRVEYNRATGAGEVAKSLITGKWGRVHKIRMLKDESSKRFEVLHSQEIV